MICSADAGFRKGDHGDEFDDLVISVVGDTVAENLPGGGTTLHPHAGAVNVIYGSDEGLSERELDIQLWHQNRDEVTGDAAQDDGFGAALAAGDLNYDDIADLVIGVPNDTVGVVAGAGSVTVLYGRFGVGLAVSASARNQWHLDVELPNPSDGYIYGWSVTGDRFGASLAIADFNGDFVNDLAIGIPGKATENLSESGAVSVILGETTSGLKIAGNVLWSQVFPQIAEAPEAGDKFGENLAAGEFNGDGIADLLIAAPQERHALGPTAGRFGLLHLLFGSTSGGLDDSGSKLLYQGGVID